MKISQLNLLMENAGQWMEELARDNTRLTSEQVKISSDLAERNEEVALIKVAHAYAQAGKIKHEDVLVWAAEKLSSVQGGDARDATYWRNALTDTLDLSPADLSGAGSPSPRNKKSAPRDTTKERYTSPVSSTALKSMQALRNL